MTKKGMRKGINYWIINSRGSLKQLKRAHQNEIFVYTKLWRWLSSLENWLIDTQVTNTCLTSFRVHSVSWRFYHINYLKDKGILLNHFNKIKIHNPIFYRLFCWGHCTLLCNNVLLCTFVLCCICIFWALSRYLPHWARGSDDLRPGLASAKVPPSLQPPCRASALSQARPQAILQM